MTSTETLDGERDIFGIGDPCGVCHFVLGPGQICGNTVYANNAKGRLPLYCGQDEQAEWQQQYGTDGNSKHRSDLATYPRKRAGMNREEVADLAAAETERRGIIRRHKASETTATERAPAPPTPPAVEDLSDALPESAVDALAELTRLITGRVVAVRHEMDDLRTDMEERAAKVDAERVQNMEKLDTERATLEQERAAASEITERAQAEIRTADDARVHAEGELSAARARIIELEGKLAAAEQQRMAEVEQVRRTEREEFRLAMREFAATVRGDEIPTRESDQAEVWEVTSERIQTLAPRVAKNHVSRHGDEWHIGNVPATRPAAAILDHMAEAGYLHVGSQGDPERVTLTDSFQEFHQTASDHEDES